MRSDVCLQRFDFLLPALTTHAHPPKVRPSQSTPYQRCAHLSSSLESVEVGWTADLRLALAEFEDEDEGAAAAGAGFAFEAEVEAAAVGGETEAAGAGCCWARRDWFRFLHHELLPCEDGALTRGKRGAASPVQAQLHHCVQPRTKNAQIALQRVAGLRDRRRHEKNVPTSARQKTIISVN
jgi:hypothetical protein